MLAAHIHPSEPNMTRSASTSSGIFQARRLVVAVALAALCLALATALPAQAGPAALAFEPYTLQTRNHGDIAAEIATLEVPRRHSEPDGPRLHLKVVRLRATAGTGRAAPVVYLAGGPG
jgi:hypothetical protein